MNKNRIFKEKGITLIALVVTIVVLLILAGVSIAVLTGENGIINRTTEAKKTSAIAQFKEDARLEHLAQQVDRQAYGTAFSYSKLINELKKKGYTIVQPATASNQAIDSITLTSNQGNVEANGSITVDVDIEYSVTGENGYYVYLEGKYYALTPSNTNGLEVASTASDIEVGGGQQGNATITATSSADAVATASVSGNTITISGAQNATKGQTATITVNVNGETFENNTIAVKIIALSTLDSVNVSTLTIDGASLITAKLTDGNVATSEDVKWSLKNASETNKLSVTSNGIVKCGTETTGNTPVKVVCEGPNKSIEIPVVSLAKIVYTNFGNANTTITGTTTGFGYNNPVIPVGFSAIDTENAKWNLSVDKTTANPEYNNGLVIMDEKGNQFVWVPVGEPNNDSSKVVNYEKWCTWRRAYNDSSIGENDEMPSNTTDTSEIFGGFWVGRYEAGLDVNLIDANGEPMAQTNTDEIYRNVRANPIIVEGAVPWNKISYMYAKENSERIYTKSVYAQSGLINGTQWDTIMKFIKEKGGKSVTDCREWGNYYDSTIEQIDRFPYSSTDYGVSWNYTTSKAGDSRKLLRTGATTQTKVLNISDIAGNLFEWTSEICNINDQSARIMRSGEFYGIGRGTKQSWGDSGDPASTRIFNYVDFTGTGAGFRIVLYVKQF